VGAVVRNCRDLVRAEQVDQGRPAEDRRPDTRDLLVTDDDRLPDGSIPVITRRMLSIGCFPVRAGHIAGRFIGAMRSKGSRRRLFGGGATPFDPR